MKNPDVHLGHPVWSNNWVDGSTSYIHGESVAEEILVVHVRGNLSKLNVDVTLTSR